MGRPQSINATSESAGPRTAQTLEPRYGSSPFAEVPVGRKRPADNMSEPAPVCRLPQTSFYFDMVCADRI